MADTQKINWTSTALRQLVQAVIAVEEEIMKEASREPGREPRAHRRYRNNRVSGLNDRTQPGQKWNRIVNLLPLELRAKVWSRRHQVFNDFKCRHVFFQLLRAYREKSGVGTTWYSRMTKPLQRLLKKWEDLVNPRNTFSTAQNLPRNQDKIWDSISEGSTCSETEREPYLFSEEERINELEDLEDSENENPQFDNVERVEREHVPQEKSVSGQSLESSLVSVPRSFTNRKNSANMAEPAYRSGIQTRAKTRADSANHISNARPPTKRPKVNENGNDSKENRTHWNEAARLQVIAAVIEVEKESRRQSNRGNRPSIDTEVAKWDRIASRLPVKLQQRWNDGQGYKIRSWFNNLRGAYRRRKLPSHEDGAHHLKLSGPVLEIMRKHEEVVKCKVSVRAKAYSKLPSEISGKKGKAHAKRSRVDAVTEPLDRFAQESFKKIIKQEVRALFHELKIQIEVELNNACAEIIQVLMQT